MCYSPSIPNFDVHYIDQVSEELISSNKNSNKYVIKVFFLFKKMLRCVNRSRTSVPLDITRHIFPYFIFNLHYSDKNKYLLLCLSFLCTFIYTVYVLIIYV